MYCLRCSPKKAFSKNYYGRFLTVDHILCISSTSYNYVSCCLNPEESIDANQSITQCLKNILLMEKHLSPVSFESNVDRLKIPSIHLCWFEMSTNEELDSDLNNASEEVHTDEE